MLPLSGNNVEALSEPGNKLGDRLAGTAGMFPPWGNEMALREDSVDPLREMGDRALSGKEWAVKEVALRDGPMESWVGMDALDLCACCLDEVSTPC